MLLGCIQMSVTVSLNIIYVYDDIYEPHGNQKPAKDSFNVDLFSLVKWPLF